MTQKEQSSREQSFMQQQQHGFVSSSQQYGASSGIRALLEPLSGPAAAGHTQSDTWGSQQDTAATAVTGALPGLAANDQIYKFIMTSHLPGMAGYTAHAATEQRQLGSSTASQAASQQQQLQAMLPYHAGSGHADYTPEQLVEAVAAATGAPTEGSLPAGAAFNGAAFGSGGTSLTLSQQQQQQQLGQQQQQRQQHAPSQLRMRPGKRLAAMAAQQPNAPAALAAKRRKPLMFNPAARPGAAASGGSRLTFSSGLRDASQGQAIAAAGPAINPGAAPAAYPEPSTVSGASLSQQALPASRASHHHKRQQQHQQGYSAEQGYEAGQHAQGLGQWQHNHPEASMSQVASLEHGSQQAASLIQDLVPGLSAAGLGLGYDSKQGGAAGGGDSLLRLEALMGAVAGISPQQEQQQQQRGAAPAVGSSLHQMQPRSSQRLQQLQKLQHLQQQLQTLRSIAAGLEGRSTVPVATIKQAASEGGVGTPTKAETLASLLGRPLVRQPPNEQQQQSAESAGVHEGEQQLKQLKRLQASLQASQGSLDEAAATGVPLTSAVDVVSGTLQQQQQQQPPQPTSAAATAALLPFMASFQLSNVGWAASPTAAAAAAPAFAARHCSIGHADDTAAQLDSAAAAAATADIAPGQSAGSVLPLGAQCAGVSQVDAGKVASQAVQLQTMLQELQHTPELPGVAVPAVPPAWSVQSLLQPPPLSMAAFRKILTEVLTTHKEARQCLDEALNKGLIAPRPAPGAAVQAATAGAPEHQQQQIETAAGQHKEPVADEADAATVDTDKQHGQQQQQAAAAAVAMGQCRDQPHAIAVEVAMKQEAGEPQAQQQLLGEPAAAADYMQGAGHQADVAATAATVAVPATNAVGSFSGPAAGAAINQQVQAIAQPVMQRMAATMSRMQAHMHALAQLVVPCAAELMITRQQQAAAQQQPCITPSNDQPGVGDVLQSASALKALEASVSSLQQQLALARASYNARQQELARLQGELAAASQQHCAQSQQVAAAVLHLIEVVNAAPGLSEQERFGLVSAGADLLQAMVKKP